MKILILAVAAFLVVGTGLPLLSHDHWTIRFFDFPRVQFAVGIAGILAALGAFGPASGLEYGVMALLGLSLVYQVAQILPYTRLSSSQVLWAEEGVDSAARVSVLVANLEVTNRDADAVLDMIQEYQPDLVLLIETDDWWADRMQGLDDEYPHSVKYPRDNAYGMCLYSKHPLVSPSVRFLVQDDVPSIHTKVALPSGAEVFFHGMHPRPPHPRHKPDTTERDAELLLLARELQERDALTIVCGDLNDVSWSYTTRLFQNISGLLDPRIGRGLFNTFHARYPVFRYPLDHAFHSDHFKLVRLEVLPYIGSDHFPVLVDLQYEPDAAVRQEKPEANGADETQAQHELDKMEAKRHDD